MIADIKTPRYTDIPLPSRRYVPGKGMMHPSRHPDGSHIPRLAPEPEQFADDTWPSSSRYLYGVDLFNRRYYWEAHEVWEGLWADAGRHTATGQFIQGLIQIAAALLKHAQSNHRGARRLAAAGLAKIRIQSGVYLGIDIEAFGSKVEASITGHGTTLPEIDLQGRPDLSADTNQR